MESYGDSLTEIRVLIYFMMKILIKKKTVVDYSLIVHSALNCVSLFNTGSVPHAYTEIIFHIYRNICKRNNPTCLAFLPAILKNCF